MGLSRWGLYEQVGKPPPILPSMWPFGGVLHFQTDPRGDVLKIGNILEYDNV